jgi:hypothetical protein
MFFKLPILFRKKAVVKQPEKLDKHAENSYQFDVAMLTVINICNKYQQTGMSAMAKEIHRQVGEKILQRGLKGWQT